MKNICLLFALLLANIADAQRYSLDQCLTIAVARSPDIERGQLNKSLQQNALTQINTARLPSIGFNVSQGANFGRSIDRFTNDYIDQIYSSTYSGLGFDLPLFNSNRNQYQKRAAQAQIEAEVFNIESIGNRLKISVIRAYYDVLAQQEMLQIATLQLATTKRLLERQNKLIAAGTGLKLELMQTKNQLAAEELAQLDAQASLENARLLLFQAMNEKPSASATFEAIQVNDLKPETSNNQTLADMPEVKSLTLQASSFVEQVKAMKTNQLPSISLNGNYGLFYASSNIERNFFQQLNDTRNGNIGLNLNIPIARRLINGPRIQALKINQALTRNQLDAAKIKLQQDLELVALNHKNMAQRYQNALFQVEIAKETVALIEKKNEAGTLNLVEYIQAQTALERVSVNVIRAKYSWAMQAKLLTFYQTGRF